MIYLFLNTYKKLNSTIIFILLFVPIFQTIFSPPSFASENSIFTPYTKVTLENGLTIIVKEVHSAPIAAIDIRVAVGAVNESPDQAGISHFVEHMLFKGTERRGVGEIAKEIQAVGGIINAETSFDTTHYYVMTPSEYIELAIDVQADAIRNSAFDPEEFERERNVILEEMIIYQDSPQTSLSNLIRQKLFAGTPYTSNVIGTPDTIKNIDRDTLLAYYHKYYVPNNMVVAVVGDVNTERVLNQLTELFEDFKPGAIETLSVFEISQPKESARLEIQRDISQTYMYFGFPVPSMSSNDGAALSVLRAILNGGRSARLNKLYVESLISQISTEYASFRDIGVFGIYAVTQNAALVEQRIYDILGQVINSGVTDVEITWAKAIIRTGYAMNAERAFTMAYMMSNYEVLNSLEDGIQYQQALEEVTPEDVKRVAEKYINPQRATLFILEPKEAK